VANYVKGTNFAIKDGLPSGNPAKIVKGTEIDVELSAIAGAIATKADINSPSFIGTPSAPTAATVTNTTQIATTEFVKNSLSAERDEEATLTLKTLTSPTINGGIINNVSIVGGSVTGLTTPLGVTNGGTGRNTLAANNVLLGNGTSQVGLVAPGSNNNVLTSNGTTWESVPFSTVINNAGGVLGIGQTWQNVGGSRAKGVTYTNTTGKPIQVSIGTATNNATSAFFVINGTTVSSIAGGDFGNYQTWNHVIPNGATYSASGNFGGFTWWELR